jgi:serine/threonine-protein kinase
MAADPTSKVPIGTVLVSKYRITREIGRGGMAVVYEAENVDIGKRVAVKVLAAELITSRIVRERFLREARAAAAVRSPYICDVYDAGEFDNRPFLVMELLEGESLYDLMSNVRRLDTEQTLKIAVQTAKGLAKAHASHVVHRDLKPENLFLTRNEDGELITKLLDFGLAKFYVPSDESVEQVRLTREGALFGTPAYMSPEQARGRGEVDHRSDLWALGCIVYECLTGQTVWNVEQGVAMILAQVANSPIPVPSHLRPDLTPAFDAWFEKALDRDINMRFQTAREFALSLADVLSPTNKSSVQTPSLLVDVDELSSRLAILSDDRQLVSGGRAVAGSSPNPPSKPSRTTELSKPPLASGPNLGVSNAPSGRGRSGGGLLALVVVAAAASGAFYGYRNWRHSPSASVSMSHTSTSSGGMASADRIKPSLERAAYAESIYRAQDALAQGNPQQALSELEVAIRNGGERLAINLRSHVHAALESPNAPCHLAGLARPRPFDSNTAEEVTRPSVVDLAAGTLFGWAQHQVFTTLLDANLRSKDKPFVVAPEAANARHPQLIRTATMLILLFWNGIGSEPGVFVRALNEEGRILGPIRRVGPIGHGNYSPTMAAAPDGTSWVVWEDDSVDGVTNLVARHLDRDLAPIGSVVQLTALRPDRAVRPGAIKPSIAITGNHLYLTFVLRRQNSKKVQWMSLELGSAELQTGLANGKGKVAVKDRFAGKVRSLDSSALASDDIRTDLVDAGTARRKLGKGTQISDDARLACSTSYCVAVWNDSSGMQVAYLDSQTGDPIWKRSVGSHGAHGTVSATENEAALAWYEGSRVQMAIASRSGLGSPSVIAKVSSTGIQPYPEVVPSRTAHQWYVAWRDFESGHFEAMLARAECGRSGP